MRVDLPEPDTPVTHTSSPSGSFSSTCLRLLPRAPLTTMFALPGRLRRAGKGIESSRAR